MKHIGALTLPLRATDPPVGVEGQVYWNSVENVAKTYNGTAWVPTATVDDSIVNAIIFG